jgi:hypothetical protein
MFRSSITYTSEEGRIFRASYFENVKSVSAFKSPFSILCAEEEKTSTFTVTSKGPGGAIVVTNPKGPIVTETSIDVTGVETIKTNNVVQVIK